MRDDILVGCEYNQLKMHTPMLNISSLGGIFYIQIPNEYKRYQLCSIYDLSGKSPREVDFFGKVQQDHSHPWVDVPVEVFSLRSGKHIYRLDFLDIECNLYHRLFVAYIAQDDNPETPYVYMQGRGNTSVEDNSWKDGSYADEFYSKQRAEVEATYGYDPLLFAESELNAPVYCSTCNLPSCENCPYKEVK